MKATDNQIMMAAATIASGTLSNPNIKYAEIKDIADISVRLAQAIAERVPEDETRKIGNDEDVKRIIKKYCKAHEGISTGRLKTAICTGEDVTTRKAEMLIYRAESLGYIENIGEHFPQYVLRTK